ncbi:hypothetical protein DIPPA_08354 [Diplonema papillatum]|nr:hypothetical protein DIPPA_08354 [Diplonema papillatum]
MLRDQAPPPPELLQQERQPAPVFKQASPAVLTARPMNTGSPLTGLSNIPPAVRTGKRLVRPSWA